MKHIKKLLTQYFKGFFFLVRVSGESGWPVLVPGMIYTASRFFPPRLGSLIVFRNPKNQEEIFVKRVRAMASDGYNVQSAVSWGSSSSDFGFVGYPDVLGTLLWRIK